MEWCRRAGSLEAPQGSLCSREGLTTRRARFIYTEDGFQLVRELLPRAPLFLGIVVVKVVASNFAAGEYVVLATIDHIWMNAQLLHHGRGGPSEVVRRPFPSSALMQDQCVVVPAML